MTHRLKILSERQRRTQQGILLDDVDFDAFDLGRHDRKEILINNPEKGTQTDLFDKIYSNETSESMKSIDNEAIKSEEVESEPAQEQEPQREKEEPERERGKSMMRRMLDAMFGEDEYREEREELEEMRNRRAQREVEEEPRGEEQREEREEYDDDDDENYLPMNVKKSYDPSSSSSPSSLNRSVLLPAEEEALSEYIQSSPPISVQSSIPSNRTIEYIEESPPVSVTSSRRSQETIEYIRSRSSSNRSIMLN